MCNLKPEIINCLGRNSFIFLNREIRHGIETELQSLMFRRLQPLNLEWQWYLLVLLVFRCPISKVTLGRCWRVITTLPMVPAFMKIGRTLSILLMRPMDFERHPPELSFCQCMFLYSYVDNPKSHLHFYNSIKQKEILCMIGSPVYKTQI